MNDIIEDQRIHYIVKDYRRMFNSFQSLIELNQELQKTIESKDKEISNLKAKVEDLNKSLSSKPEVPPRTRAILGEMENQLRSILSRAENAMERVDEMRILMNFK